MAHPAVRIEQAVAAYGYDAVVDSMLNLLDGELPGLGLAVFGGSQEKGWKPYWLPVWGARCGLYLWREDCAESIIGNLRHEHWRVREMCAKVCRYRQIGVTELPELLADPVPRVRMAAARALGEVGEAEHAEGLHAMLSSPEPAQREAAKRALSDLEARLDRRFD